MCTRWFCVPSEALVNGLEIYQIEARHFNGVSVRH
jgi:hypothetical protein